MFMFRAYSFVCLLVCSFVCPYNLLVYTNTVCVPYVCVRVYGSVCNARVCNFSIFQKLNAEFHFRTARRFLWFRFNSILFQNHIIHSVRAHYSQIKLVNICARCGAYLFKMIYGYDFHPLFFDWVHIQLALFLELPGCNASSFFSVSCTESEKVV